METRPTIRPPRQDRSQRTLRRILSAAEQTLESKPLSEVRISEVADRAGVTTGAIYARFGGKEALFSYLQNEVAEDLMERMRRLPDELPPGAGTEECIHAYLREVADFYRNRRGGVKALARQAGSDPQRHEARLRVNQKLMREFVSRLPLDQVKGRRSEAEAAVRLSLLATTATLREVLLFRSFWPEPLPESDAKLCRDLSRLCAAYISSPTPGPDPGPASP